MRRSFFWVLVIAATNLLIAGNLPCSAQDDAPRKPVSLDEYKNVPPGLLMPGGTADNGLGIGEDTNSLEKSENPNSSDNSSASDPPASGEVTEMTTEGDILDAFQKGKFDTIARRVLMLANKNRPQEEEILGIMYHNGTGVPQDYEKAHEWLKKASDADRPLAQHYLGVMAFSGEGEAADPVKGLMWLYIAIVHYPDGPRKDRAMQDSKNIYTQLDRRDRERALFMARETLAKKGEAHLLEKLEK